MCPRKNVYRDLRPTTLGGNTNNVNTLARNAPAGLVALAFDGANVDAGADRHGGRPDYRSIIADLSMGRPWIGTVVLLVERMTAGVARFVNALREIGLSVITSHREIVCGRAKACDDVILAAEAACAALDARVSELVLVSGDGDLAHVCEIAKRAGKRVTVAGFRGSVSFKLVRAADETVLLSARHVLINDAR